MYIRLNDSEIDILKEFENPNKWSEWRSLSKKLRFVLQRMIMDKSGTSSKYVLEMATEASHSLNHHIWCKDCGLTQQTVDKVFFEVH